MEISPGLFILLLRIPVREGGQRQVALDKGIVFGKDRVAAFQRFFPFRRGVQEALFIRTGIFVRPARFQQADLREGEVQVMLLVRFDPDLVAVSRQAQDFRRPYCCRS